MREAENEAREAILGIVASDQQLSTTTARSERTRAAAVDRLAAAVDAAWLASKTDPAIRERARAAKQAWSRAEHLRWELAMSGARIAHGEARKLGGVHLDHADLVQEGFIGLARAAKRFDPERKLRFSTYARWWVRAQMTRAIDNTGRQVRLPGCAVEQRRNLRKAMKSYDLAGLDWTIADLAEEVGIDVERARLLLSQRHSVSLDAPLSDENNSDTLGQLLPDEGTEVPDEAVEHQQELQRLREAMDQLLDGRLRRVLNARYGLGDHETHTLREIGDGMELSRERVRQLEKRALDILRTSGVIRPSA